MASHCKLSPFKWANEQYRALADDARRRAMLATGIHRDSFLKIARECEQRVFETEADGAESRDQNIVASKSTMRAIKKVSFQP